MAKKKNTTPKTEGEEVKKVVGGNKSGEGVKVETKVVNVDEVLDEYNERLLAIDSVEKCDQFKEEFDKELDKGGRLEGLSELDSVKEVVDFVVELKLKYTAIIEWSKSINALVVSFKTDDWVGETDDRVNVIRKGISEDVRLDDKSKRDLTDAINEEYERVNMITLNKGEIDKFEESGDVESLKSLKDHITKGTVLGDLDKEDLIEKINGALLRIADEGVEVDVVDKEWETVEEWEEYWGQLLDFMDKGCDSLKENLERVKTDAKFEEWRRKNWKVAVGFYKTFARASKMLGFRKDERLTGRVKGTNKYLDEIGEKKKKKLSIELKRQNLLKAQNLGKSILASTADEFDEPR